MKEIAETVQALSATPAREPEPAPATVGMIRQRILDRLAVIGAGSGAMLAHSNGGPSEGATLVDMYQRLGFGAPPARLEAAGLEAELQRVPTPLDEALDKLVVQIHGDMRRSEPGSQAFTRFAELHLIAIALQDVRRQRRASTAP